MGLDTSHGAWSGAYSAFSRWRNAVAEAGGYVVAEVKFDEKSILRETVMLHWGEIEEKNFLGEWDKPPTDPLVFLLAHSDCDGEILPEHAKLLADRLEGLLPKLKGDLGGHIGDVKEKTKTFIDGLREAVEANEPLDFH